MLAPDVANGSDRLYWKSDCLAQLLGGCLPCRIDIPTRIWCCPSMPTTPATLGAVFSYLAGRTLSKEEIWTAMELPGPLYDQLEKGTLITPTTWARRPPT